LFETKTMHDIVVLKNKKKSIICFCIKQKA